MCGPGAPRVYHGSSTSARWGLTVVRPARWYGSPEVTMGGRGGSGGKGEAGEGLTRA
jgi:hypothetical protein